MNKVNGLQITGTASASQAATQPNELMRKAEVDLLIAGVGSAGVGTWNATQSAAVTVVGSAASINVRLKTVSLGAGEIALGVGADGLYVPTGAAGGVAPFVHSHALATTSLPGFMSAADKIKLNGIVGALSLAGSGVATTASKSDHTHGDATSGTSGFMSAADKVKVDASVSAVGALGYVAANLNPGTSATITWSSGLTPSVKLASGAGLGASDIQIHSGANGIYVRAGSAADTLARGNHSHLDATSSASGFMSAADKIKLDLSVSANQALAHVSANLPLAPSNTVVWSGVAGEFKPSVRVRPIAGIPSNRAALIGDTEGLAVVVGTTPGTAAAGDHAHPAATSGNDGLMTAAHVNAITTLQDAQVQFYAGYEAFGLTAALSPQPLGSSSAFFKLTPTEAGTSVVLTGREVFKLYNPSAFPLDVLDTQTPTPVTVHALAAGASGTFVRYTFGLGGASESYEYMGP